MVGMLDWLLAGAQDYGDDFGGLISGKLAGPSFRNRRKLSNPDGVSDDIPVEETGNPFHRDLDAAQIGQAAKSFYGPPLAGMLNGIRSLNDRPKSDSPFGESAAAPPDGGLIRPGSPLASLFGSAEAAPDQSGAQSVDESGMSGLPPSTNDPASREPEVFKNGVPLPRPRPITPNTPASVSGGGAVPLSMAPGTDEAALPPGATSTAGNAPQMSQPGQPQQGGGIGGIISNLLRSENAPLLLSLAGGFAGAPSIGTGMRRAFSAAAPVSESSRKAQIQQQGVTATYQALIAKGVPPQEAMAAVLNPDVMKATAAKYFETKPRQHVMMKDALGGETPMSYDPNTGKYYDAAGNEHKPDAEGSGLGGGGILAPGVKKIDQSLSGDEYLGQFSKDVQASVKAYINGDVQPSGNPRQKAIATFAKNIAQRYGQDTGIPVSDSIYAEKRKYRTELGTNSPNSAGGQAKAFNQGVEHAHALAQKIEKLGNWDPLGIPMVSHGINAVREGMSTTQKGKADEVRAIGQTLAGEVGKLFSGAAGGGVHERELTRNRFNSVSSNRELAGALEGTIETMEGGLRALEQRRDQVLGPNSNVELVNKETHQKIDEIKQVIKRLKGEVSAAPAAMPKLEPGQSTTINGVTIKRM